MQFTQREAQILEFIAHGYTPDEIGDFLGIARETVRKIICKIKIKVKLQKSTELAAFYWCRYFGSSLEDQRKQLLASVCALIMIISIPMDLDRNRHRIRYRSRIECSIRISRKDI